MRDRETPLPLLRKWTAPTYVHADDMPPDGETVIYPVRKPPKQ